MRFAYADPPYLGCAVRHYGRQHDEAAKFDTIEGHADLIASLAEFDGWAMSCASVNLRDILPLCPVDCRVGAWVKPFASFKPGVNPAYAWEPVVFRGAKKRKRDVDTVRDWVSANITLQRGVSGAKPIAFVKWVIELLGVDPDDEFVDLFPGSGVVSDFFSALRTAKSGVQSEIVLVGQSDGIVA